MKLTQTVALEFLDAIKRKDQNLVVKMIKDGLNPNSNYTGGHFSNALIKPLEYAIQNKDLPMVELLLENGAELAQIDNSYVFSLISYDERDFDSYSFFEVFE